MSLVIFVFLIICKVFLPIESMYDIFTYIYHKNQPNVGKYTWILWVIDSSWWLAGFLNHHPHLTPFVPGQNSFQVPKGGTAGENGENGELPVACLTRNADEVWGGSKMMSTRCPAFNMEPSGGPKIPSYKWSYGAPPRVK